MYDGSFLYFAYGSNMLTERLRLRCPSAQPLGIAVAHGHALEFSKRSVDGSAKATLVATGDAAAVVPGVLFTVAHADLPRLDVADGVGIGYDRDDAFRVVRNADGLTSIASTYLAPAHARDVGLVAYDWYLALTVAGALQRGMPEAHVAALRAAVVRPDPEPLRQTRQEALAVLLLAGFDRMFNLGK